MKMFLVYWLLASNKLLNLLVYDICACVMGVGLVGLMPKRTVYLTVLNLCCNGKARSDFDMNLHHEKI